ncbi:MAG: TIGR04282 family arsenosugar biosynthesis glycosyltransferase [Candidatus Hodarchaeales archaeon]
MPDFPSQLQTAMLLDTLKALRILQGEVIPVIAYHPEQAKSTFEKLIIEPLTQDNQELVSTFHCISQRGFTFVDRFKNTFKYVFQNLDLPSALIIGSDTPHIQPSLIQTAIEILRSNSQNSVLGPSQNGGFYLLGHNEPYMDEIGSIFQKTDIYGELGSAMDLLLSKSDVHILPEVTDIDNFEDLKSVRSIMKILSSNYRRGKNVFFPEYTFNLINKLDINIWNS